MSWDYKKRGVNAPFLMSFFHNYRTYSYFLQFFMGNGLEYFGDGSFLFIALNVETLNNLEPSPNVHLCIRVLVEFSMARRATPTSANTASHIEATPKAPKAKNTPLTPMAKTMF